MRIIENLLHISSVIPISSDDEVYHKQNSARNHYVECSRKHAVVNANKRSSGTQPLSPIAIVLLDD